MSVRARDDADADAGPTIKRIKVQEDAFLDLRTLATSEENEHAKELINGITEFVRTEREGFSGILKYRYTDFQVHEVQQDGSVTYLKSLKREKKSKVEEEEEPEHAEASIEAEVEEKPTNGDATAEPAFSLTDEDRARLVSIFGEDLIEPILGLYGAILKHPERKPRDFRSIRSQTISEKDSRTAAHQAVRQIFNSQLETRTKEEDMSIEITKPPTRQQKRGGGYEKDGVRVKGAAMWEELGGDYTHFTLYKENRDTMEVLNYLAGRLKVSAKNFSFGGTKDRRAVTTQRVSAYRLHAVKFEQMTAQTRGCAFGDFENRTRPCALGEVAGNHFTISLRDCHFPGEQNLDIDARAQLANATLQSSVQSFEELGFINYFGLQRFGTYAVPTDEIGKKMLQGDFKSAVDSILHFEQRTAEATNNNEETGKTSETDIQRAQGIALFRRGPEKTQDALKLIPKKFSAERAIITHLGRRDRRTGNYPDVTDFQGGLSKIPRNLRTMYVHAYQSLVWNHMAGARIKLYGPKVVEGDLILIPKRTEGANDAPEVDEEGEPIIRPADEDRGQTDDDFDRARPLSKEEAESGRYTIFDLVLPLPGWDVVLPSNNVGEAYEKFMASERGGGLNPHDMRRQWKEISLSGGYRTIFSRPNKVEYEVRVYESEQQDLVETDLERLQAEHGQKKASEAPVLIKEDSMEEHRKIAVILKFQLGTSQYATMALRELCGERGVRPYQPDYAGR